MHSYGVLFLSLPLPPTPLSPGPVPVEEVLVSQRIKVPNSPCRIPEQRVRKLIQRSQLGLEPQAAHLPAHTQMQRCNDPTIPMSFLCCIRISYMYSNNRNELAFFAGNNQLGVISVLQNASAGSTQPTIVGASRKQKRS